MSYELLQYELNYFFTIYTTKISAIKSKNLCTLIKAEIICYWIMDADFAHRALIFFYKNKEKWLL